MTRIKKIIIVLISILIIAVIMLATILILKKNNGNSAGPVTPEYEGIEGYQPREINTTISYVINRTNYYAVQECLNRYYSYYSVLMNPDTYYTSGTEELINQAKKDNAAVLYNMLDRQYTQEKGVTAENLEDSLKKINIVAPYIYNMYVNHRTDNIDIYVVKGKIKESITDSGEEFTVIIKLDTSNKAFSVMPSEYVEEKKRKWRILDRKI